jgi:cell division transport system ATP-binding protein
MIRFDQVSKTYPAGNTVLSDINFHIHPGELVVITGHSGAGKTTLARMLIKDVDPTGGQVFIDGEDLSNLKNKDLPSLRKKIAVIFQDYKIIPDKTVTENIKLALDIIGLAKDEVEDRISHLLNLVEIDDKRDLFPIQLSGGELQRAAIARALALDPQILFADEPTGNLDDETASQIVGLLQKINKNNTTVLIATHNLDFAKLADRHIKLNKGKIESDTKRGPDLKEGDLSSEVVLRPRRTSEVRSEKSDGGIRKKKKSKKIKK